MNLADQTHLAAPAAISCKTFDDVDSGAMFSAASVSFLSHSNLRTRRGQIQDVEPFKKADSFFIEPKAEIIAACRGDYNTALLVTYFLFRYQLKDDGTPRLDIYRDEAYWWAETYEDIANRLNKTNDQIRLAAKKAAALKLLEVKRKRYYGKTMKKYYGKTVLHWRLAIANGAAALSCWPSASELMRMVLGWDLSHLSNWDKSHLINMKEEGEEKKKKKKIQTSPDKSGQGHTPLDPKGGQAEPNQKTAKPENLKTGGKEDSPHLTKSKGKPVDGHLYAALAEKHDMEALLHACINAGLTDKGRKMLCDRLECRYLSPLAQQLERSSLNDSLESFLAACADWEALAVAIAEVFPGVSIPNRPNFRFLKKYAVRALEKCAQLHAEATTH